MLLLPHEIKMLSEQELSQKTINYFKDRYDKRFVRALRAVDEDRVVRYHFVPSDSTTWIVCGRRREYMVIPETYCTCRSFYQDVVISRESKFCYHLLAQKIAQLRNSYKLKESTDSERRKHYVSWRRTD